MEQRRGEKDLQWIGQRALATDLYIDMEFDENRLFNDGRTPRQRANKEEELRYLKAVSLQIWLFSYELPDTVIAFIRGKEQNEMHAIASGKKAKLLENARETIEEAIGGKLRVHSKPKNEDGSQQVDALVTILKEKCTKIGACSKS